LVDRHGPNISAGKESCEVGIGVVDPPCCDFVGESTGARQDHQRTAPREVLDRLRSRHVTAASQHHDGWLRAGDLVYQS
jgi:hypothetical protein